jgi:branched-chain amino acid transport system permease protein
MTGRTATVRRWTPVSRAAALFVAALIVLLAFGPWFLSPNAMDKASILFIYVILAVTWNALAGYGGLVSIGQQCFIGLGGYGVLRLSEAGLDPFLAVFAAAALVGVAALVLSSFMLKLKQGEFAIGMWVLAALAHLIVNLDPIVHGETGASLLALDAYEAGTRRLVTYLATLAAMIAVLGFLFALLRSPFGASLQAIRDNEGAAASVGVRVMPAKRVIFVAAAVGAALGGALWLASTITFQPRTYFGVQWTAYMIFMCLVGGLGAFEGPIFGAIVFFAMEALFEAAGVWYLVALGAACVGFTLFLPKGLWGAFEARSGVALLPVGRWIGRSWEADARVNTPPRT